MRGNPALVPAVTVEQLKAEAAKLPPGDRLALAEWIEDNEGICALRHQDLVREIDPGLEQANRGELIEADEVFERAPRGFS